MAGFDTPRLHLRPLGEGDEALYCRLYTDPDVMRHIAVPLSAEAAQRALRAASRLMRQAAPSMRLWVLSERDSSVDIGILALIRHGDMADAAEMGTMLLVAGQGRGLAAEAQAALMDRLFRVPEFRMVWSRHAPDHGAVVGVKLKLGFVRAKPGDAGNHEVRWQMTRERWRARRADAPA